MRSILAVTHEIDIAGDLGLSEIKNLVFEMNAIPDNVYPKSFSGRIMGLSQDGLDQIRSALRVAVGFRSRPYKLDSIQPDGSFTIHRDWLDDHENFRLQQRIATGMDKN
jgi:hypothetical protein